MSDARHGKDGDEDTVEGLRAQRDQLAAELVAALAELDRIGASSGFAVAADGTGPLPAVPPQRARSRHAARPTHLKLVRLLIPGAALGALKYAWHAHRVATAIAGTALTAAAATTTVAVVAAPAHSATHRPGLTAASLGPAWQTTGVPIPSPSAKPGLDAKSSRKSRLPVVVMPVRVPSASPPPATIPPSSTAPPAPLLTVPAALDLGVYVTGTVTIGNPQDRAVSWSVSCGADVIPLPAFGVLMPGQQGVQVTLSISPVDGASGGVCTFEPGGERVTIDWAGAGAPSSGL